MKVVLPVPFSPNSTMISLSVKSPAYGIIYIREGVEGAPSAKTVKEPKP
jgi:hypothetical protein